MGKIIKIHIKRHHIVKSKDIKDLFELSKNETIIDFGMWRGRSPYEVEHGANPDTHDEWFIETDEVTKGERD